MKLRFELRYLQPLLLLLLMIGFAVLIGAEIGWGRTIRLPLPEPKLSKSKLAAPLLQAEFTLPPMEAGFSEIIARPLFVTTRRPPPPPVIAPPPRPSMQRGQFVLLGVILTKEKNLALLREVPGNKVHRVEQGQEIRGIQVEKLLPEKVTLKQWDEREELILKIQAAPKPVPQPVQAAAPVFPNIPPPSFPGAPPPIAMPSMTGQPAQPPPGEPLSRSERRRALLAQ